MYTTLLSLYQTIYTNLLVLSTPNLLKYAYNISILSANLFVYDYMYELFVFLLCHYFYYIFVKMKVIGL